MNWLDLAFDRATWPKKERDAFYAPSLKSFDDLLYEIYLPTVSKYMLAEDSIKDVFTK